jgi:hypothetical protein
MLFIGGVGVSTRRVCNAAKVRGGVDSRYCSASNQT